jgi:transposase
MSLLMAQAALTSFDVRNHSITSSALASSVGGISTPSAGRPSIDPMLMIRMLIVGYVFAIRSERRICAEVQVNLAYHWFCNGLGCLSPALPMSMSRTSEPRKS